MSFRPSDSVIGEELVIERLIPEGKAMGRLSDGRVAMVDGAVPGDRIVIEEALAAPRLVKVTKFRLLDSGPARILPRCELALECGGCDWMMMRREAQVAGKRSIVAQALERTAKIDPRPFALPVYRGEKVEGYRGRVRLQVAGDRVGFYSRGSHQLVEPSSCAVSSPALNGALAELRAVGRAFPGVLAGFAWVEVREDSEQRVSMFLQRSDSPAHVNERHVLTRLRQSFVVVTSSEEARAEATWQRFQLTDDTFMLSPPGSFTQVNWEVNRALVDAVLRGAEQRGVASFLDVYAGSGNFSLPLLARGLRGLAVEFNASAIQAARVAANRQGLPAEAFVAGDAAELCRSLGEAGKSFELVLVDPPRAGLKHGLQDIAWLARAWLLMCSCNPVTLARDLAELLRRGFELDEITAFDMFPETHHVESLVWLRAPGQRSLEGG